MIRRVASLTMLTMIATLAACSDSTSTSPTDAGAKDATENDAALIDGSADAPFDAADAADVTDAADADSAELVDAGPCALDSSSTLPGVAIHFTATRCTFTLAEAAAGITVPYEVTADADVTVIDAPDPSDLSRRADAGPSGLHLFEILSGGADRYCLCDTGLPFPIDAGAGSVVHKGSHPFQFTWDGKNWSGPSDTSTPEGPPFAAGTYRLEVRARGSFTADAGATPFLVMAAFRITLVP